MDSLYSLLYKKSRTNRTSGAWSVAMFTGCAPTTLGSAALSRRTRRTSFICGGVTSGSARRRHSTVDCHRIYRLYRRYIVHSRQAPANCDQQTRRQPGWLVYCGLDQAYWVSCQQATHSRNTQVVQTRRRYQSVKFTLLQAALRATQTPVFRLLGGDGAILKFFAPCRGDTLQR